MLIQRGTCPFTQKYQNALEAGAAAVLIFNDGFEGREAPLATTAPTNNTIPAAMISNDIGEALARAPAPRCGSSSTPRQLPTRSTT